MSVENVPYMSIQQLKESVPGDEFKLTGYGLDVRVSMKSEYVVMEYRLNDKVLQHYVRLDYTRVGYGLRPWFICSSCKCRTANLYFLDYFACRGCHQLVYESSKRSGNEFRTLTWKVRKRQRELGMPTHLPTWHPNSVDIYDVPFYKPKGMRWTTFEKLRIELEIMQMHRTSAWLSMAK